MRREGTGSTVDFDFLLQLNLFRKSLAQQKAVVGDFWRKARIVLEGSGISLKPLPRHWTSLRHNHFSVLFLAVFYALGISPRRVSLFARINHCFRAWVTACDNLLDRELKEMVLTDLPAGAEVFKSVHTLLLTDRIFMLFLLQAVREEVLQEDEMETLIPLSLSSLSASGRQEAREEGGVSSAVPPAEILYRFHRERTGRLFAAVLEPPLALGDIVLTDRKTAAVKEGLETLGLGCQILDDLCDLEDDLRDGKANYVAALVHSGHEADEKEALLDLLERRNFSDPTEEGALCRRFPAACETARGEASEILRRAFTLLGEGGLPFSGFYGNALHTAFMELYRQPELLGRLRS
jgi:geranylgeranyl pyrophosphate synthase